MRVLFISSSPVRKLERTAAPAPMTAASTVGSTSSVFALKGNSCSRWRGGADRRCRSGRLGGRARSCRDPAGRPSGSGRPARLEPRALASGQRDRRAAHWIPAAAQPFLTRAARHIACCRNLNAAGDVRTRTVNSRSSARATVRSRTAWTSPGEIFALALGDREPRLSRWVATRRALGAISAAKQRTTVVPRGS